MCSEAHVFWRYRLIWFNAQRNCELSVAAGGPNKPKKSLAWNSVKDLWSLCEMWWMFTREIRWLPPGKRPPMPPPVCLTSLVIRMPTAPLTGLCSDTSPMVLFVSKSLGGSRAKHPLSCKHRHLWVKTKQHASGISVSSVIQSDIAWVRRMKHVQDQDSAAVKSLRNLLHHMSQA